MDGDAIGLIPGLGVGADFLFSRDKWPPGPDSVCGNPISFEGEDGELISVFCAICQCIGRATINKETTRPGCFIRDPTGAPVSDPQRSTSHPADRTC